MQNAKKRASALMACVIALAFALSALFVLLEADHNCSGDDCQVCQAVNICLHIFDNTTPKPETFAPAMAAAYALVLVIGEVSVCLAASSLISLKVKLSN